MAQDKLAVALKTTPEELTDGLLAINDEIAAAQARIQDKRRIVADTQKKLKMITQVGFVLWSRCRYSMPRWVVALVWWFQ